MEQKSDFKVQGKFDSYVRLCPGKIRTEDLPPIPFLGTPLILVPWDTLGVSRAAEKKEGRGYENNH